MVPRSRDDRQRLNWVIIPLTQRRRLYQNENARDRVESLNCKTFGLAQTFGPSFFPKKHSTGVTINLHETLLFGVASNAPSGASYRWLVRLSECRLHAVAPLMGLS